jgi:hypothetical protein
MTSTCAIREVAPGEHQYVPLAEVFDRRPDETVYDGRFTDGTGNYGPSGSHKRTICTPVGNVVARRASDTVAVASSSNMSACVMCEVAQGEQQFVPVSEVVSIERSQTIFYGVFEMGSGKYGPSGSHTRTICTPQGELRRVPADNIASLPEAVQQVIRAKLSA